MSAHALVVHKQIALTTDVPDGFASTCTVTAVVLLLVHQLQNAPKVSLRCLHNAAQNKLYNHHLQ